MSFITTLREAQKKNNSLVCVGLDPELSKFPEHLKKNPDALFEFHKAIIDATADLVCCYKPQIAHFSALSAEDSLQRTIAYIHENFSGIPVILDAKRGDIGSTAERYAVEAFDRYQADAVTLNPYLGRDSIQPFLDRTDKGVILLCRTSNKGAQDFQDLICDGKPLYQHVAKTVAEQWNTNHNCMLVVGATWPEQLAQVRAIVGDMPLLVPGVGAQGGDVAAMVTNGKTASGDGLVISSSRAILYASSEEDFADVARKITIMLRDDINRYR
jgi:orotidine-5'-phosphate decarboxylase